MLKGLSPQGTVPEWYYHFDGLGSVTDITDSSGAVLETYSYDAYGAPTIKDALGTSLTASSIGNRYMFTGREYDEETGLYYYRARHYSPTIGRFLQRDDFTWAPNDIRVLNNEFPFPFVLPSTEETVSLTPILSRIISDFGQKIPPLLHRYNYVTNNPINFVDPYGLSKEKDKEKPWWERACFGRRFWQEFERRRVPGAKLFGIPTSLIGGVFTGSFYLGPKSAARAATRAATKGFQSFNLGKYGVYVSGYKPGWFTAAGAISKGALLVSVFYLSADVTTIIDTRITIGCEK